MGASKRLGKEAEPFVGDQFSLINGVRVPQRLYHSAIEKARGWMSAFDPFLRPASTHSVLPMSRKTSAQSMHAQNKR